MKWLHCSSNKLHAVTKTICVLYEGRSNNGGKISFFLVLKYIIFINIINNVMAVIVTYLTWFHHGITPLMWCGFCRGGFRCFQCLWQFCVWMCCRGSYTSLFLCYCYFSDNFALSTALIISAVIERFFLVVGPDKTPDTTSWWVSDALQVVLK